MVPTPTPSAPSITTFTVDDATIIEGTTATFSWTLSGDAPTSQIVNPGDGSATYTVSPGTTTRTHVYASDGAWTASLTVTNAGGSDVDALGVVVSDPPLISVDSFTVDDATPETAQQVTFSWTTSGDTQTAWSLDVDGDGNADYSGTNETSQAHTYTVPATVTPTLSVTGAGGTDIEPYAGSVVVSQAPGTIMINAFSVSDSTPTTDIAVTFSWATSGEDQTGATLDPGDGSAAYTLTTETSQVHTYTSEDVVDATLVVTSASDNDTDTISGIDITAPSAVAFYDWGQFTSMTETRRNASGGTQVSPPVKFKAQFHKGEVPTTRWFDLYRDSVLVPTDEWQLGEISTFPDGSMRSAVVRCYGPASWANNTSVVFELVGKAGTWPALATDPASDATAITLVTDDSALKLSLEDITLLGSPYLSTTQPAYGEPDLDSELNRALARTVTRKYAAGDICIAWRTWEKMQPPGGGTEDNQLWVLWFVEAWLDPSTGNIAHLMVEPYLNHGWARVQGMLKGFKMKLVDGATTLRDFATSVTLDASDFLTWNGATCFTGANRTVTFPYATFDGRFGTAVKVSGDPPSGYVAGKIYEVGAPYGDGPTWEPFQRPHLALGVLGQFRGGSNLQFVNKGTGGTTYTLTHYNYACDKQCMPIRDGSGIEFWPIGGAAGKIWPNWTRAEKIRRMQTGMIPNVPLELVTNRTGQSYQGHPFNSGGKNTGLLPLYNHLNNYTPGATLFHRQFFEDGGYWFSGLLHKSECSWWFFNLLNDMERDVFHRTSLMTAAESIGFLVGLNHYENETSGGIEIAYPIVINNGPNKAGAQYTGMGTCRPTALSRGGSNQVGVDYAGSQALGGGTVYDESQALHWSTTSGSGAHGSKEIIYAEALHCSPGYRELITHLWMRAAIQDFTSNPAGAHYGSNKVHDGVTYYRVASLATTPDAQKRAFVARAAWLGYALSAPDTEPYRAMLDDIAADNVNYLDAVYDDPDVIGSTAKVIGVPTGAIGGEEQAWHLMRVNWAALVLMKLSGIESVNYLKFHTAFGRWYFNDPIDGSDGPPFHSTGWFGTEATHVVHSFDQAAYNSAANVACGLQWMRDEASSVTDASRVAIALPASDFDGVEWFRFSTDGETVQYTMPEQDRHPDVANMIPDNGDMIKLSWNVTNPGGGSITALQGNVYWYLYDKTVATQTLILSGPTVPPNGATLTDSAGNTATMVSGGGYRRGHCVTTIPTPSPFVAGPITASTGGGPWTFSGTPDGYGYDYKLSTTDPAVTTTPKTWTTASTILVNPSSVLIVYKNRRQGNQLGGLMKLRNNAGVRLTNQGWLGHIFAPVQVAATMFGKDETGLAPTVDALATFYANCLAGQSFYFYEINDSSGAWSFHYAYPPGAT